MSWESTAVYYRLINTLVRERLGGLRSAEIVLRSIDFERVVALQKDGQLDGRRLLLLGRRGRRLWCAPVQTAC